MLKTALWPWLLITVLGALPFLALMAIGGWWLWQQQLLLLWLSISASCGGIAWIVAKLLNRYQKKPVFQRRIAPQTPFSQRDQAAWQAVNALAEQLAQDKTIDMAQIDNWLPIGRQVLAVVAKHYYPKAENPELKIPVTELLRIIEHVSHDMHQQLLSNLPGSHVITLADGLNLQRWLGRLNTVKTALRLGRMLLNPLSGFLNEAGSYAHDKVVDLTLPRLQSWLLQSYVEKVGEYAILLYSGRMATATAQIEALTSQSDQDYQQAQAEQQRLAQEPLRILVAGQTNAGKSTLINILFDRPMAATDVLSCTAELIPYQLKREGLLSGLIFDTPGYGEQSGWLDDNQALLDQTDLLLLVCSANQAARQADRRFLQAFTQHFLTQTHRKLPPIITVVTHIDALRPLREWQPPYNIATPTSAKAKSIQAALSAIQTDLDLSAGVLVPVSLGDNDGMGAYNVDALIQAMGQQMDEAQRSRLLRCLTGAQDQEKWPRLWRQLGNSGRWLLKKAGDALP